jgi:hypothetical protein
MAFNSVFCKKTGRTDPGGRFANFFKNEKVTGFLDKLTERMSDRLADGIDKMFDRVFKKNKQHST